MERREKLTASKKHAGGDEHCNAWKRRKMKLPSDPGSEKNNNEESGAKEGKKSSLSA